MAERKLRQAWWADVRWALALWGLAGVLLLGTIGTIPLERTQEARVLESAREMMGQGWRGWMIPHLNGRVRLKKPPLAYWLSAGAYKVFGVNDWAGRIPMALSGWLTVGVVYAMGRRIFGPRAGLLGAGALVGSFLFYRYARLAETDVLSTFFVTAGVYAMWRGYEVRGKRMVGMVGQAPPYVWYQMAGVAVGLAALSKGPPAAFPILFLLGLAAVDRRWRALLDFLKSWAILAILLVALPWYLYIARTPEAKVIGDELSKIIEGDGHTGPAWFYIVQFFRATLPWVGFAVLALAAAIPLWRKNPAIRGLLVWILAMLIPMSIVGQKQDHYMLPVMPPIMLLVGWALDRAIEGGDEKLRRAMAWVFWGTLAAGIAAAPAVVIGAKIARGVIQPIDWIVCILIALLMVVVYIAYRAKGLALGLLVMLGCGAVMMSAVQGPWAPTLLPVTSQRMADAIQAKFGDGPYVFYALEKLPLTFHMGRVIPLVLNERQLEGVLKDEPSLVVIHEARRKNQTPPPAGMIERMRFVDEDKVILVYRREAGQTGDAQ